MVEFEKQGHSPCFRRCFHPAHPLTCCDRARCAVLSVGLVRRRSRDGRPAAYDESALWI
jgi:hypothetical protein